VLSTPKQLHGLSGFDLEIVGYVEPVAVPERKEQRGG
jgi:hypothetical protein